MPKPTNPRLRAAARARRTLLRWLRRQPARVRAHIEWDCNGAGFAGIGN